MLSFSRPPHKLRCGRLFLNHQTSLFIITSTILFLAITATVKVTAPTTATTATTEAVATDLKLEGASIVVGAKTKLVATVTPANAKVTFESKDPDIATVDAEGNVTGVKAGTAVITATSGTKVATAKVTVSDKNTVKSVEMLNAVQAKVSFNTDVKAEATNFLSATNQATSITKLSDSEYIVTFDASIEEKKFTVNPVETKENSAIKTAEYVVSKTAKDTTAPTIESVDASTNGDLTKITFTVSEPLKARPNTGEVAVAGQYAKTVTDKNNAKTGKQEITATFDKKLDTDKALTLTVYNMEDKATKANKTIEATKEFTAKIDKEAPTVEATAVSDHVIRLTFSKDLADDSDFTTANVGQYLKVVDASLAPVTVNKVEAVKDTKNQFDLTLTGLYSGQETTKTVTIVLTKDKFVDLLGNKVGTTTKSVSFTKDTVAPSIESVSYKTDADGKVAAIVFTASEELSAADASKLFTINSKGVAGDTGKVAGVTLKAATVDKNVATFKLSSETKLSGKYTLSLAKGFATDKALAGNESAAKDFSIDFGAAEATDATFQVSSVTVDNKNKITVVFAEPVDTDDARNKSNYAFNRATLPEGTPAITLNEAGTEAYIPLPASSVAKDASTATFKVSGIKSADGKKTVETTLKTGLTVKDTVAPAIKSIRVVNGVILVDITEEGTLNTTVDSEKVSINGTALEAGDLTLTKGTGSDANSYVLTSKANTAKLVKGAQVTFDEGAIKDSNNNESARAAVTITEDKK